MRLRCEGNGVACFFEGKIMNIEKVIEELKKANPEWNGLIIMMMDKKSLD